MGSKDLRNDQCRLWLLENRAGPATIPAYMSTWQASDPEYPRGEPKTVQAADPSNYGRFLIVDKIPGEEGAPSVTVKSRYSLARSKLLALAKTGCDCDVHLRFGKCSNPTDPDRGWEKILVLEGVAPSGWKVGGDLNVFESKERAPNDQELKFTGDDIFEIAQMKYAEQAGSLVLQEVVDITFCDTIECGSCGTASDGCQKVFAVTKSHGGSPGLPAQVIWTDDQGASWNTSQIDSIGANEDPSAIFCAGGYLCVITNEGDALHYADIDDIIAGTETWTKVTGFNAAGSPNAAWAGSADHVWVVGDGGYIYLLTDVTATVTAANIQDAGAATVEDLTGIHGFDLNNIIAWGANNAIVHTTDGGITWAAVTGPAAGVALTAGWMRSESEWLIGTASDTLWYTRDSGVTWAQIGFSGSGTGTGINDIAFSNDTVGFMARVNSSGKAQIQRTIDGGHRWYVVPEDNSAFVAADELNALAVCPYDPNVVFGGGLADDASDGVIIKGVADPAQ